jgi:hypothetical protein
MGDLSDFERGLIFGARLAGASVAIGCIKNTVSKVMLACTNHGKTISGKRRLSYIYKDCYS